MRGLPALLLALMLLPFCAAATPDPEPAARLLTSDPEPYVGEEFILCLELRHRGRPGSPVRLAWPDLSAFVVNDLPGSLPRRESTPTGPVTVETARKLLRPITAGRVELKGAGMTLAKRFLPAGPLTLRPRPLPQVGRPEGFTGIVGAIELKFEDRTGELLLTLRGNAPLDEVPTPRPLSSEGSRLPLIADDWTGRPGQERSRTLRYLRPEEQDLPPFRVSWFDPDTELYRVARVGPEERPSLLPRAAAALAVLIGAGAGLYRWRRLTGSLERQLERLLGRPAEGLSRHEIVMELAEKGVGRNALEELERFWEQADRQRYTPGGSQAEGQDDGRRARQVARRLAKGIDNPRRIP